MFNSDVILMSVKHTQGCVRTQADQPCEGRFYAVLHLPEQNVGRSHRLFDIFLSSGGNRQKKAEIWRKKMSIKIVRLSVAFIVNAI